MPANDLALIEGAAREAGEIALRHWRRDPKVWDKGEGDPVSEADLEVDTWLRTTLTAARPDHGWLSEETADDGSRQSADRVFIVDPIDGTRAFVRGEEAWAVAIAIAERGRITAGVVHLPAKRRTYAATLGGGATRDGLPISASARESVEGARFLVPKTFLKPEHWPGGVPEVERSFLPAIAYRLARVAEGRADALVSFRRAWEWDIAAGALIAEEAGHRVTGPMGEPLAFNDPSGRQPGLIVANPRLHAAILARRG